MVNPDIDVPQWTGHRHQFTHNMWDGAKWPAEYCLSQHPTTIRAILPVLATKAMDGRASESEKAQLRELRVWDLTGKKLLPSPHHCAQWLGIPEPYAISMLGPNKRCLTVIDDLQCEAQEHWDRMAQDLRPPADRMSQCRTKHWCKDCAKQISIIGNGWHVAAASAVVEAVLYAAVRAKRGSPTKQLDYSQHAPHQCPWNCRYRMKLGDVKQLAKAQRKTAYAARTPSDIIDI